MWLVAAAVITVAIVLLRRASHGGPRRRRGGVGTGAAGAVYDLLNEDKRRAMDLIVEEKAEARRPEYPDGNKPDLDAPKK